VLEDEYFLADDLDRMLTQHGAEVVGPISDMQQALGVLQHGGFDAAIMNVTLQGHTTFDLADELTRQNIPFMFLTGFAAKALPARFRDVKLREKPCSGQEIAHDVAKLCEQCAVRRLS
jgi:CheY-like chemotaxis protein